MSARRPFPLLHPPFLTSRLQSSSSSFRLATRDCVSCVRPVRFSFPLFLLRRGKPSCLPCDQHPLSCSDIAFTLLTSAPHPLRCTHSPTDSQVEGSVFRVRISMRVHTRGSVSRSHHQLSRSSCGFVCETVGGRELSLARRHELMHPRSDERSTQSNLKIRSRCAAESRMHAGLCC